MYIHLYALVAWSCVIVSAFEPVGREIESGLGKGWLF
jgi:hypothetical protein